jgi:two-component system, LytTR family, sensor kinase
MLFIPFIENSFKYSKIEESANAFIEIELATRQNEIRFTIRNSIPDSGRRKPGAGTGIENVRKRLNIIFPQKHTLQLREANREFSITLTLILP